MHVRTAQLGDVAHQKSKEVALVLAYHSAPNPFRTIEPRIALAFMRAVTVVRTNLLALVLSTLRHGLGNKS